MIKPLFLILALMFSLQAKVLVAPSDAMKSAFGKSCTVAKKNIMLSKAQAAAVQKSARTKLASKIFRTFVASQNGKAVGYGILINRKIRTKSGTMLYLFRPEGTLKTVEIIAFNEPPEYIPSHSWLAQFENVPDAAGMQVGKSVATITGATLSARSITDGARVAAAVFEAVFREAQ